MRALNINVGDRFHKLEVIEIVSIHWPHEKYKRRAINCLCDCGKIKTKIRPTYLKDGRVKSCGCSHTTHGLSGTVEYRLFASAKERAKEKSIPFDLEPKDIVIPELCPLLNIPLEVAPPGNGPQDYSPSLDRLEPNKGYVKGNVRVISVLANRIKTNASLEQILLLSKNLPEYLTND